MTAGPPLWPQSCWLIHIEMWAGSRACCTRRRSGLNSATAASVEAATATGEENVRPR